MWRGKTSGSSTVKYRVPGHGAVMLRVAGPREVERQQKGGSNRR
ncbi:hypothetical protein [Sphingomonas sp. ERG5]